MPLKPASRSPGKNITMTYTSPLVFLTDDIHEFEDAAAILSEVKLRRESVSLPEGIWTDLQDIARRRVLEGYRRTDCPTFTTISALLLRTASGNLQELLWHSCDDLSEEEFCNRYSGVRGVIAQVLAFCEDGINVHIFQRDIPGIVSDQPSDGRGSGFDRMWIPNGYKETLASLSHYNNILTRRKRLYFDLANHLGLETANDLYEIHVTVNYCKGITVADFEKVCKELGVKAIHIELPYGNAPSHLITGSFHKGPFEKVKAEAKGLASELSNRGFNVTRIKIEAMIRNSLVPPNDEVAKSSDPSSYFEFHVKVAVDEHTDLKHLMDQCVDFGVHLSRNASNKMADGVVMHFATLRVHQRGREAAVAFFQQFLSHLRGLDYKLSNILQEYTVFDTNIRLDDGWFNPQQVTTGYSTFDSTSKRSFALNEHVDCLLPPNKQKGE